MNEEEMTQKEALAVLGLEEDKVVMANVKPAYRAKAKLLHPDKGGDASKFKQLVKAYEILIGKRRPVQRPAYVQTDGWVIRRVYTTGYGSTTTTAGTTVYY